MINYTAAKTNKQPNKNHGIGAGKEKLRQVVTLNFVILPCNDQTIFTVGRNISVAIAISGFMFT